MTAWGDQPPLSRRQVRMNQRVHEGGAELSDTSETSGNVDLDIDPAEQSVPFDTFPPAVPSGSDAASSRFDAPSASSAAGIRPGSRRAMRLAETGRIDLSGQPGFEDSSAYRLRDFRPVQANDSDAAVESDRASVTHPHPVAPAGRPLTRRELRALEESRAREVGEGAASDSAAGPAPQDPALHDPALHAPAQHDPAQHDPQPLDPPALVEPPRGDLFPSTFAPEPVSPDAPVFEAPVFEAPAFKAPAAPGFEAPEAPAIEAPEIPAPAFQAPFSEAPAVDQSHPSTPEASEPSEPIVGSLAELAPPIGVPFGTSPTQVPTLADLPAPQLPPAPDTQAFVPQYSLAHYPPPVMLPDSPESARGIDLSPQQQAAATGHWTTQEALDDASQTGASVTSRDVGVATGPITSSALVLPAIPDGSDLSVPFSTATGEVLITGSINLPATLGTTGAHPSRYDHSDLDAIIEASDRDDAAGESAPVRAVRAVSTHTSPRDVIAVSRTAGSGNRLPIVLAITAGAMMVSVTVLVVAGFISGTF